MGIFTLRVPGENAYQAAPAEKPVAAGLTAHKTRTGASGNSNHCEIAGIALAALSLRAADELHGLHLLAPATHSFTFTT